MSGGVSLAATAMAAAIAVAADMLTFGTWGNAMPLGGGWGGDRFVQGTEIMSGELVVNNETVVTTELTGSVDGVPVITGTA